MMTQTHLNADQLDRYRSGLMPSEESRRCAAHLHDCPQCQRRMQFGARLSAALGPLPRLAAQAPHRHVRALRWPRVFGAGMVTASIALAAVMMVPHMMAVTGPGALPGSVSPQVADAVQNMDFYQWLANHPQMLQQGLTQ